MLNLCQPIPQPGATGGGAGSVGHLHVIADHGVGVRTGDVGADTTGQQGRIAPGCLPGDRERIVRPHPRPFAAQSRAKRMPLDHLAGITAELGRQCLLRRQHQDAMVRVAVQQPCRHQPQQSGFPAIAEGQQQQSLLALR